MLPFLKKALAAQAKPKKSGFSVAKLKKLVATVEGMGKSVASVQAAPDGSLTVSIGELSPVSEPVAYDWDKELE